MDKSNIDVSTPILNAGLLPPLRRGEMPKALIAGLVIGVASMEILALLGGMWHEHWPAIFLGLIILAIIIHEAGHLAVGWAIGFHFTSIQVGPLFFENEYGARKVRLSFDIMALGSVAMYADNVRKLRRRSLFYLAGGIAANSLTVMLVILVSYLVPPSTSRFETTAGLFGEISLIFGLINLLPIGASDGALIEMLLSSPLPARRWISLLALGSQLDQGVRPRNWKQTWVNAAIYLPDKSSSEFYANWLAYMVASDRKDVSLAAQYLERCLELTPTLTNKLRDTVAQEAAVYNAWFREDLELAEKWFSEVKKRRSLPSLLQTRLAVALHCARHDFDNAITAWKQGFELIEQVATKASNSYLKDSWIDWRTEILDRKVQLISN